VGKKKEKVADATPEVPAILEQDGSLVSGLTGSSFPRTLEGRTQWANYNIAKWQQYKDRLPERFAESSLSPEERKLRKLRKRMARLEKEIAALETPIK